MYVYWIEIMVQGLQTIPNVADVAINYLVYD